MNKPQLRRRVLALGLGWSVVLAAGAAQPRVQITGVYAASGQPEHAIVRGDGAIIVSGQFAGSEGNPFSNLLILDSGGGLLRSLPPLLYPHNPGNNDTYYAKYTRCDAALDDGSFIVEKPTSDIVPGNFRWGAVQPLHLNPDGTLDESFSARFGTNGPVFQIAFQSDGKLLFAGAFGGVPIRRTLRDGTPDPEFTRQVASAGLPPVGSAMVTGSSGKIWLWPSDFNASTGFTLKQLVRLNSDGSRDLGFSPAALTNAASLVAQPDGKLLVSAGRRFSTPTMIRLNEDGSLDTGFNLDPNLFAGFDDKFHRAIGPVTLMPSGHIVIAVRNWSNGAQSIKRLLPDGRLDPAFKVQRDLGWLMELNSQPDGKLLAINRQDAFSCCPSYLVRLNQDSSVDSTFDASATAASYIANVYVDVAFARGRRGFQYALEASADLRAWTTMYTHGPLDFDSTGEIHLGLSDADAGRFRQRFYRGVEIAP